MLKSRQFKNVRIVLFAVMFGLIGVAVLVLSHAASVAGNFFEAEAGTMSGSVSKVADSNASGRVAVAFGGTNGAAPSGEPMPVGSVTNANGTWNQIFSDDFVTPAALGTFPSGSSYSSKWTAYPAGWKDTSKNGTYNPAKVLSVSGGVLDYYMHTENGVHYVSAPLPVIPKGKIYGRYSIRMKSEPVYGYKIAFLLWPDSENWPDDGEIDFPEANLNGSVSAFNHFANPAGGQNGYSAGVTLADWHTYTTEWGPGKVIFYVDGRVIGTSTTQVSAVPMHYVMQAETNLGGSQPTNDTAAGHIYVDWVSIYNFGS